MIVVCEKSVRMCSIGVYNPKKTLSLHSFSVYVADTVRKSAYPARIVSAKIIKMFEILIVSVLIIAIAMALLSVKVLFRKGGTMSSQHIHDSQAMKERGIHCVMDQDREQREHRNMVSE